MAIGSLFSSSSVQVRKELNTTRPQELGIVNGNEAYTEAPDRVQAKITSFALRTLATTIGSI